MTEAGADFTNTFRALVEAAAADDPAPARAQFADPAGFDDWAERWRRRLAAEATDPATRVATMRRANPAFVARNHRVEAALVAAEEGDLAPFERLLAVLAKPFDDQPDAAEFAAPPRPGEEVEATFCGT